MVWQYQNRSGRPKSSSPKISNRAAIRWKSARHASSLRAARRAVRRRMRRIHAAQVVHTLPRLPLRQ